MDKQGLVAPVWSDAGEVPVGEVTFDPQVTRWTTLEDMQAMFPLSDAARVLFGLPPRQEPSNPNAKPALPALTRVSGNKRGPGWCDE